MPNRIIKESIRTSRSVNALPDFLFRVWVYLITYVDDYGRGSADPQLLKGLVFPRYRRLGEEKVTEAIAFATESMTVGGAFVGMTEIACEKDFF